MTGRLRKKSELWVMSFERKFEFLEFFFKVCTGFGLTI